jgi:hypothetical protein
MFSAPCANGSGGFLDQPFDSIKIRRQILELGQVGVRPIFGSLALVFVSHDINAAQHKASLILKLC